jgi:hypothetical protein
MNDYRKGSLGESDAKMYGLMLMIFAILVTLTWFLFIFPFGVQSIVGYPHAYFVRADNAWKGVGIGLMIGWHALYFWKKNDVKNDTVPTGWVWLLLILIYALMIPCLAGWDFSLRGIES